MTLQFEVFDGESGAFIFPDRIYDGLTGELDQLVDDLESGQRSDKAYLGALNRLIAAAPDFINGYTHIATYWHDDGKPKKALEAALLGLSVANRYIPEGFSGRIEWGHLDNRPYLRLIHIALLSYLRLSRHRDAVKIIELMLARNPNDNQGVRYLLGSEALRSGDHALARKVFAAEAAGYPAYYYELALSYMFTNEWGAAATALRRGFAANPYLAEILLGYPAPPPLAIWHASNLEEPEAASEYVQMYGSFWWTLTDSLPFTRWLFNQPKVMVERAAILECKEALLWTSDAPTRSKLIDQQRRLTANIDDAISTAIVTKRKGRGRQMIWPWSQP